jgi:hypothetical protein
VSADFTRCFECGHDVHVDEWDEHACPPDPRNGPYDLDHWDVDDSDEESGE